MDGSDKKASRPKSRQSIAHIPSLSRTQVIDKQNATIDLSAARSALIQNGETSKKRTRGKSLGPGGLEALRETEGNTTKTVSIFQPKSILKPTVPLTPPKSIPSFDELRQRSSRKKSPGKSNTEALLIDFSTPGPSRDVASYTSTNSSQNLFDPFSPVKVADATGNHENGILATDEEERLRQERKKTILEQRAARRKSMANRRVSFAPEATLHTWSVMELAEDSTTSSASNSTRRQSSITTQQTPQRNGDSPKADSVASDPPSTPPRPSEEPLVKASPARQRELHQKKRRRSSNMSADMNISDEDVYSSSPSGDITTESSPIRVEDSIDSDSDTDGDTAMSMDEVTQNTIKSPGSASSTQSSLEERLRQAANQAGTKGIEYDEYGDDMSMEIANDTVTNAFQPWSRNHQQRQEFSEDQENVNPFSPAQKVEELSAVLEHDTDDTTQGMTMEMTKAVGGIIGNNKSPQKSRRKSTVSRRRSSIGRRRSLAADSSYGDETMDFTTVAGGILSAPNTDKDEDDGSDEDMTMEFTTAVGGVQSYNRRESTQSILSDENETMDMTAAVGGILAPIEEQTEPQTDVEDDKTMTMAMDMTRAVGQILPRASKSDGKDEVVEPSISPAEDDTPEVSSPLQVAKGMIESTPKQLTSVASETGSPSLALKSRSSGRRSARISQVSTPRSAEKSTPSRISSTKKQSTPTKQLTPVPTRAKTPERTPISAHVTHRGSSPRKLFQAEIAAKASPASSKKPSGKQEDPLFAQDELTGRQTPRVILQATKPHQHPRRRSSGIGIDKEGFGSPSVTQLLSRRSSIGEAAPQFKFEPSQTPRLRFEDPKQIADELDAERAEDERRESGRFVMEQEANEQQEENATLQLRDMIESLSPKKHKTNKLKGRKSLAVGSARGLLGKRPMELDDEDEESSTPKRLRAVSREGSPVKKIHLPKPPTKEETTGRLSRVEQKVLDASLGANLTPTLSQNPTMMETSGSPQPQNRYRDVGQNAPGEKPTTFEDKLDNVLCAVDATIIHPIKQADGEGEKVSLQEFLNMTNIHFIELNTTKRRHTMAQATTNETIGNVEGQTSSMKDCFVAAATTMPLLELYQHATKELKSYISTGRKIIRSIENETLVEQPALFREYIEARPDVKLVMDNQFRNGKTNARLQSKEGWYTWRSQLVDGLRNGLEGIQSDIEKDLAVVEAQAEALDIAVPELTNRRDALVNEAASLQQRLDVIDSADYLALKASRQELHSVDLKLQEKLDMLQALQHQMQEKDDALAQAAELKEEMEQQIAEANKYRQEHQGWNGKDIKALRSKVDTIRKQTGWSLLSAEEDPESPDDFGVALTMSYKDTLRLFFYPSVYSKSATGGRRRSNRSSHSGSGSTAPISLTFSPLSEYEASAPQLSTERRFILQLLQSQLQAFSMLPRGSVHTKTILDTVSSGWKLACRISEEIRLLNLAGIARVSIQSDEELSVKLMLMVADKGRVDIEFTLVVSFTDDGGISVSKSACASGIYGPVAMTLDASKTRKVQGALTKEIENQDFGDGAWINAVQAFEEWYRSQPQPQQRPVSRPQKSDTEPAVNVAPLGSTTPKSPVPTANKTPAVRRSPLAAKKSSTIQKKIPVPTSRQDKFRTSQQEPPPQMQLEKPQMVTQELAAKEKENIDPFVYGTSHKAPAITPEMQEAMMQRTPIKRVGALRRSPI